MTTHEEDTLVRQWDALIRKIATRFVRSRPVDWDEAYSDGLVGLLEAIRTFDPSKGASLKSRITALANCRMLDGLRERDHLSRTDRRAGDIVVSSLDATDPDGDSYAQSLGEIDRSFTAIEAIDEVEASMRRLRPVERAVLWLYHVEEMQSAEIARRLNVTENYITQIAAHARAKLARGERVRKGHEKAGYQAGQTKSLARWKEGRAGHREARRKHGVAMRKFGRERQRANLALGNPVVRGWYLLDEPARRLIGWWPSMREAMIWAGVTPLCANEWLPAALGWPALLVLEARLLAALVAASGPLCAAEAASAAGMATPTVAKPLAALARAGLVVSTGRQGRTAATYAITQAALGQRGPTTHLVPIRGEQAKHWKAQGYAVLPPCAVERKGA